MLPSASTYLQISAKAQGAKTSAAHQQMARAHWMDARLAREKTIALQCIKTPAGQAPPPGAKRADRGAPPRLSDLPRLKAVIHVEFDRMRRHAKTRHLFHLERDVRVEHVVREDPTASQKFVILLEVVERFVERRARMRNLGGDFRGQVVQVLVDGIAGVDLVLHAVEFC